MRKRIIGILILITGLYGAGFSYSNTSVAGRYGASDSWERERYEEVYSSYSSKIDLLYKRLDEKNTAISDERRRKNPDYKKVERLENEKMIVKRELDSTYADLRYDLRQNRVRDYSYRN